MSVFGSGLTAAALRERILRALGAEDEWIERGGPDFAAWMSGPAATFFHTQPGSQDAPDLGVLRIVTPVAVAADRGASCYDCDQLNREATVSRWVFVKTGRDADQALAPMCSFVVGPHNLDELTGFAVWCARVQIATATAALDAGIAKAVGDGTPYGWGQYSPRELRAEPHPVTRHADEGHGSSAILPGHLRAARLLIERIPSPRLHGAKPMRIYGELDGLTLADTDRRSPGIDVLGTWRQHEHGLCDEVIVPRADPTLELTPRDPRLADVDHPPRHPPVPVRGRRPVARHPWCSRRLVFARLRIYIG